ncbi:MAG: methylmalonyl Co-A mutase-associated GTPase MeaB [Candidatus Kapaibacterium sp.]
MSQVVQRLVDGVRAGDRRVLAKVLTIMESTVATDEDLRHSLLEALVPHAGGSYRLGLTGAPGVGKSTLIEAVGSEWIRRGKKVAVLAVDPSSARSGGSILGDKLRMPNLARSDDAFIRPSPSGASRGGIAPRTRESIMVCEAAGYDVVIVESVGVGQAEFTLSTMVDLFVLLLMPNAGDDVQAVKRGIMEMAHIYVVTKCDVDERAAISAQTALHSVHSLMRPVTEGWSTRILATSAVASEGIVAFVDCCTEFFSVCTVAIEKERRRQSGIWYDELVHEEIIRRWFLRPSMQQVNDRLRERVLSGSLSVPEACRSLFSQ